MQHTFELTGGLMTGEPTRLDGCRSTALDCAFTAAYPKSAAATVNIDSTSLAPFDMNLQGLISVQLFAIKILDGSSITVLLTSAAGTDQAVNVSGLWIWHSPVAADALTVIQLVGTGQVEYLIAGH